MTAAMATLADLRSALDAAQSYRDAAQASLTARLTTRDIDSDQRAASRCSIRTMPQRALSWCSP